MIGRDYGDESDGLECDSRPRVLDPHRPFNDYERTPFERLELSTRQKLHFLKYLIVTGRLDPRD